jgi:hypothetical protein
LYWFLLLLLLLFVRITEVRIESLVHNPYNYMVALGKKARRTHK